VDRTFGQVFTSTTGIVLGSFNVQSRQPLRRRVGFRGHRQTYLHRQHRHPVQAGRQLHVLPQSPAAAGTSQPSSFPTRRPSDVYSWDRAIPGEPIRPIANLTTAIPRGTGTFSGFTAVAQGGTLTSFIGTGTGQAGVYSWDRAIPGDPIRPIVNLTTAIPGGTGTFIGFSSVSTSLGHTAFLSLGNSRARKGIYLATQKSPG
jgi:hypothetical protein